MKNLILSLALGIFAVTAHAADPVKPKPYALDYCVLSGEKLGEMGKPTSEIYEGQEIKFCCKSCQGEFDGDPAAGLKKYNAAVMSKSSGAANAAQ